MSLADQITNHEPWNPDQLAQLNATGAELNALRDELLELRRLRTAAARRDEIRVQAVMMLGPDLSIQCRRCLRWTTHVDRPLTLAELLRRADQHGEECP